MERVSIKETSVAELERALEAVLQQFTNREWEVVINELVHQPNDPKFFSKNYGSEYFRMSLRAGTKSMPLELGALSFLDIDS